MESFTEQSFCPILCYCILQVQHLCYYPATTSPLGSQENSVFLCSVRFLLHRAYPTGQHKQYFFPLFFPSSLLQSACLALLPLFWVFLLCLHFCEWIIFCICFCEKEKTKQNKWALWNVKEAVKQQSWNRRLNCITNGSFYLIEKQRSGSFFFFFF